VGHPRALNGTGEVVNNLEFHAPGQYEAFWDGKDVNGNEVASGKYIGLLLVNGQRVGFIIMVVNK
jgi:flagellar hook assembly protein FlgD